MLRISSVFVVGSWIQDILEIIVVPPIQSTSIPVIMATFKDPE